jgi:hypothetical protein
MILIKASQEGDKNISFGKNIVVVISLFVMLLNDSIGLNQNYVLLC